MKTKELKEGDSINIPEGCVPVIKDNVIVFKKQFEDGDILTSMFTNDIVFIFRENKTDPEDYRNRYYVCFSGSRIHVVSENSMKNCGVKQNVRHATEEEKQFLFYKMKENGLEWNEKEKRVERIWWEPKEDDKYYYISSTFEVNDTIYRDSIKNKLHVENYNSFHTEEQATKAASRMKETLRLYHKEIGE